MTLPKKLQEKRDKLCAKYKQDCLDNWHSPGLYLRSDFNKGFDEAYNLLLPEIKKLEESALDTIGCEVRMFGNISNERKNQMSAAIFNLNQALQSLREFLGSEAENE